MSQAAYIHGTDPEEQVRLAKLGDLTDEAFVAFIDLPPGASVLDVGSGLGNVARPVALRIPGGDVWGIERSEEQLAKAPRDLPNLQFHQGDAHALPFEAGRFDVVYCRYLLEHVSDPVRVLREMRRVLKPGGKAFVQENDILCNTLDPPCPAFDRLWRQFARLQELLGGDALIGRKLYRLMSQAGFEDVQLSIQPEVHHHGLPTFRPWLENLIGNLRPVERAFVEKGLATVEDVRRGVEELRSLIDDPSGSAFFYWNRAIGTKPI
jgi:ubiquinone/menaquinone biosynthesis C-methylase UbiE